MPDEKSFHMTPEEFRRYGHAVVDWIADYQSRIESFPVLSQVKPGEIRAGLPNEPPARGENFDAILGDINRVILPGVTHWQSPEFLCVLSLQCFRARNSGRSPVLRTGRSGNAVVDQSGMH